MMHTIQTYPNYCFPKFKPYLLRYWLNNEKHGSLITKQVKMAIFL